MTNPIAIAPKSATPAAPGARPKAEAIAAEDFAQLIAEGQTPRAARPMAAGSIAAIPAELAPAPGAGELAEDLGTLLEKLVALAEKLKDGPLDEIDTEELDNILAGIETLLSQDAPLPLPQTPAFDTLAALARSLGHEAGGTEAGPIDTLAALAAKIADGVREQDPDLAARLTGFTRTLDTHAAEIQSAVSAERAAMAGAAKQIESETKLNPAAAIAAESSETAKTPDTSAAPAKDPAAPSERTLVKEARSAAAPAQDARPQQAAAAAAALMAATAPEAAELDAPDGLATPAPQPQATSGPTSAMRPEAALYQRPETQINLPHIAAEISRHVQNGTTRFEIRLNPPELGRIDVRMEVDNSGNVVARLAVERTETLDLLQRDQRALERALADAGLDSAKTELEFSLQQEGSNRDEEPENAPWRTSVVANPGTEASTTPTNADLNPYMRGYARLDAVNLWV